MNISVEFLKSCANLPTGENFGFFISQQIPKLATNEFAKEHEGVLSYLENVPKDLNTIAIGVNKCLEFCIEIKKKKLGYSDQVLDAAINKLKALHVDVAKAIDKESSKEKTAEKDTNFQTALISYDRKLEEMQKKIEAAEDRLKEQENSVDSKVFQLLINNVALLAIFVAIALAGFGGIELLTQINLQVNLLSGMLSFFLIAVFIYNMVLMLLWFIVLILNAFRRKEEAANKNNLKVKVFVVVDVILVVVTIITFVSTLIFQ